MTGLGSDFWRAIDASFYPGVIALLTAVALLSDVYRAILWFAALTVVVAATKWITQVRRPDGSDNFSFPSGHAATSAFVAAALSLILLLKTREQKDKRSARRFVLRLAVAVVSVAWAVAIAASRVALKRHRLLDVLVGAPLGAGFAVAMMRT